MSMTYGQIKAEDIQGAMKASSGSITHDRKSSAEKGVVWNQTVSILMERVDIDLTTLEPSKECIQQTGTQLKEIMSSYIFSQITIPETGTNKKGEKGWKVCGKDGKPQWSSWVETKVIWGYIGDVAKVLCYGLSNTLYPEKFSVAARCEILKACKVPESIPKALNRLGGALQQVLDKVSEKGDIQIAANVVNNLMVNNYEPKDEAEVLLKKLDVVLSSLNREEKDGLKPLIAALAPHFA